MEGVRGDQTSLFTDSLIARGQGRGISLFLTKSLFTVDSTQGSFPEPQLGTFHITGQQKK